MDFISSTQWSVLVWARLWSTDVAVWLACHSLLCAVVFVYLCVCISLYDSWMYWTDWEEDEVNDSIGRIEKAWMDGSNRRIFVTSNMLWPNGLTLDHVTSTMYWCDAYYDHIEKIHLNGTGRMVSLNVKQARQKVATLQRINLSNQGGHY